MDAAKAVDLPAMVKSREPTPRGGVSPACNGVGFLIASINGRPESEFQPESPMFNLVKKYVTYMGIHLAGFSEISLAILFTRLACGNIALAGPTGSGKSTGATMSTGFFAGNLFHPLKRTQPVIAGGGIGFIEGGPDMRGTDLGLKEEIHEHQMGDTKVIEIRTRIGEPATAENIVLDELDKITVTPRGMYSLLGNHTLNNWTLPTKCVVATFNVGPQYSLPGAPLLNRFAGIMYVGNDLATTRAILDTREAQRDVTSADIAACQLTAPEKDAFNYVEEYASLVPIPGHIKNTLADVVDELKNQLEPANQSHLSARVPGYIERLTQVITLTWRLARGQADLTEVTARRCQPDLHDLELAVHICLRGRCRALGILPDYNDRVRKIIRTYETLHDLIVRIESVKSVVMKITHEAILSGDATLAEVGTKLVADMTIVAGKINTLNASYAPFIANKLMDDIVTPITQGFSTLADLSAILPSKRHNFNQFRVQMGFLINFAESVDLLTHIRSSCEEIRECARKVHELTPMLRNIPLVSLTFKSPEVFRNVVDKLTIENREYLEAYTIVMDNCLQFTGSSICADHAKFLSITTDVFRQLKKVI